MRKSNPNNKKPSSVKADRSRGESKKKKDRPRITKREKPEEILRQSEECFRKIYNTSPDAIGLFDINANIVMMNPAAAKVFGYSSSEEMLGKNALDFFASADRKLAAEVITQILTEGMVRNLEFALQRKDGSYFTSEFSCSVLSGADGNAEGFLAITRDITERKQASLAIERLRAETSLREANQKLEHALRVKDEFLATVSHELRTPLNSILGMSESMLIEVIGPINARQTKYLKSIQSSGEHLLSLINDILDLSKVEAEKLELNLELILISDICQSSLSFVKELASQKRLSLKYESSLTSQRILADARRLKQILVNLLSNAVKFTPTGGIVILKSQVDEQNEQVLFTISDTGIGISPADLERLFEPFTQLDTKLSRQYEGTGLGLSLVKKLTELHGGTVSVTSEVGKGSQFTVSIPWTILEKEIASTDLLNRTVVLPNQEGDSLGHSKNKTILLAEDNDKSAMVVEEYLAYQGYRVIRVADGSQVLEVINRSKPDLILMDIQMHNMDGLEAIKYLRRLPEFNTVPIIAVTALAMKGDRERCLAAGATDYVSKPYSLKALAVTISTMLNHNPPPTS